MHNATTSVMDNWKQHSLGWHSLDGLATEHGAPLPTQKGNIQGKSCREKTWRTFASIPTDEPQAKQVRIDDAQVCDIPECSGVETRGAQLDDGTLSDSRKMDTQSHLRLLKSIAHYVGDECDVFCELNFNEDSQQKINAATVMELLQRYHVDPEVLLSNLGFGSHEGNIIDKLPLRFIASASSANGITTDLLQKNMMRRYSAESDIIKSRFSKVNVLANVVDTFSNISARSTRKPNAISGSRTLSTTSAWSRLSLSQPLSPPCQTEEKALVEGSTMKTKRKHAFSRIAKEHFFSKSFHEEHETKINQQHGSMEDGDHARAETQVERDSTDDKGNPSNEGNPSGMKLHNSWNEQNRGNDPQVLNIHEMSTKEEAEETGSPRKEDEREATAADHSKPTLTEYEVVHDEELVDNNLTNLHHPSPMNGIPHSDEAENPSTVVNEQADFTENVSLENDFHDSSSADQSDNSEETTISQEILRKPWDVDEETDTLNLNSRMSFEDPLSSNGSVAGQDQVQEQDHEVRSQPSAGSLGDVKALNRMKLIKQIQDPWMASSQSLSLESPVIHSSQLHSPIESNDEEAMETPREDGPPHSNIPAFREGFTSGHANAEADGTLTQTPSNGIPSDVSNPCVAQGNAMPERITDKQRNAIDYNPHLHHINPAIKSRSRVVRKKLVFKETQSTNNTGVVPSTTKLPGTTWRSGLSENAKPQLASPFEQNKGGNKENVRFTKEVFPSDAWLKQNSCSMSVENSFVDDVQTSGMSQDVMAAVDENFLDTRSLPSRSQMWDNDAYLDVKNIRNIPHFPPSQNHQLQECTRISKPPRGSCHAQETWINKSPKTQHRRMHAESFSVPQNDQNHLHRPQSQVSGPRPAGVAASTTASRLTSISSSRRSAKLNCLKMAAQDIVMTLERLASWQNETLAIAKAMLRSTTKSYKINSAAWLVLLTLEAGQKDLQELYGHLERVCTETGMCADDAHYLLVAIRRDLWKLQGQLTVVCADLRRELELDISKGNEIAGTRDREQSCFPTFKSLSLVQQSSKSYPPTLFWPSEEYEEGTMTRGCEE